MLPVLLASMIFVMLLAHGLALAVAVMMMVVMAMLVLVLVWGTIIGFIAVLPGGTGTHLLSPSFLFLLLLLIFGLVFVVVDVVVVTLVDIFRFLIILNLGGTIPILSDLVFFHSLFLFLLRSPFRGGRSRGGGR